MPSAVTQFAYLAGAALLFATGGLCMQASQGLRRAAATVGIFLFFCAGAACQALGMRGTAMSTVYVIVLGLEAISAFLLGAFFLGERISWERAGALLVIVAGIVWLRRAG